MDRSLRAPCDVLVARGSTSLVDANTVPAPIEDLDVANPRTGRSADRRRPGVCPAFGNLGLGSRKPPVALISQLDRTGTTDVPPNDSLEALDAIVASPIMGSA